MTREQMLEEAKYAEECKVECISAGIDESEYADLQIYWYKQLELLDK